MKGKGLIGLTVVVVLVTAYTFLDYWRGQEKEEKKEKVSLLFPFEADEVAEVFLHKGDKNDGSELPPLESKKSKKQTQKTLSYIFKKEKETWHLQSPVKDWANQKEVKDMLGQLTREKYKAIANEGETLDWSLYGLEGSLPSVFVRLSNGKSFQVFVGSKKNFQGSAFLKREVEGLLDKKVYIGTHAWSRYLGKELKAYRDRRLFRKEKSSDIKEIQFSKGDRSSWTLVKKEGLWLSPSQKQWNLSSSSVRSKLLDKWEDLEMDKVLSNSDPSSQEKSRWKLTASRGAWFYKVSFQDGTLREMHFSSPLPLRSKDFQQGGQSGLGKDSSKDSDGKDKKEKQVYVWLPQRKKVYTVAYDKVQKIQELGLLDFRDREEPFKFDRESVASIFANWKLKKAEARHKKGSKMWVWYEQGKATDKKLDTFKIDDFVDSLLRLRVDQFLSFSPETPPLPLNRSISLKDEKGVTLFHFSWSEPFSKKVQKKDKEEEENFVYTKTNLIKDLFVMKHKQIEKLNFSALLPLPEEKKDKGEKEETPLSKGSKKTKKSQKESS